MLSEELLRYFVVLDFHLPVEAIEELRLGFHPQSIEFLQEVGDVFVVLKGVEIVIK